MNIRIAVCCVVSLFAHSVFGQDEAADETDTAEQSESQSGFDDLPRFGGPRSITAILKRNDTTRDSLFEFTGFPSYFDGKRRLGDEYGLALGGQVLLLYQEASSSLPGEDDDALGYTVRFLGNWTLFKRDNGNFGRIGFRIENRSNIGDFQSPISLGSAMGVGVLGPGFGFPPNFETDISVLHWSQRFDEGRGTYAIGRFDFGVFLDASPAQHLSAGLLNRAFVYNPTLPVTGFGALGGVIKGFVSRNIWIGAQFYDANAETGRFDFDTAEQNEWIKAVEVGITPSFLGRHRRRVQLTFWEKDARQLAGTPRGRGWAMNAAYAIGDRILPFVRIGQSDGGGGVSAEDAVSAGIGITFDRGSVWSFGAGWARPSEETFGPGLRNESVIETSFKLQLFQNFSLTPNLQLIFNPMFDTSRDSIWVAGVRMSLTL